MAPLTTPGLDAMLPIFYKSLWHIVDEDVTPTVLHALNTGTVHESLFLARSGWRCYFHSPSCSEYRYSPWISQLHFHFLIPKIKNPKRVVDFRPISLYNVIYKLIAKGLVNRMKLILPHVVHDSQSAFLFGRLITDNVLVAFETLHYIKRKT